MQSKHEEIAHINRDQLVTATDRLLAQRRAHLARGSKPVLQRPERTMIVRVARRPWCSSPHFMVGLALIVTGIAVGLALASARDSVPAPSSSTCCVTLS